VAKTDGINYLCMIGHNLPVVLKDRHTYYNNVLQKKNSRLLRFHKRRGGNGGVDALFTFVKT
jgi:hypothetical protein